MALFPMQHNHQLDYINHCLERYFCWQVAITITWIIPLHGQGLVFCLPFRQKCALNWGTSALFHPKSTTKFGRPFCPFHFSFFYLKMAQIKCCFCLSRSQKSRQKTRPPPFTYYFRGPWYHKFGGIYAKQTVTARSNSCTQSYRIDCGSPWRP